VIVGQAARRGGRCRQHFESKAEATGGGQLEKAIGRIGGTVRIHKEDGTFRGGADLPAGRRPTQLARLAMFRLEALCDERKQSCGGNRSWRPASERLKSFAATGKSGRTIQAGFELCARELVPEVWEAIQREEKTTS